MRLPERIASIDHLPRPPVRKYLDAHVHPWPPRVYEALLRWFDKNAWEIAERVNGDALDAFLAARGVTRYVALVYAHRAGMAAELNRWLAEYARAHPAAIPMGTVHPDDDVRAVLGEAFDGLGLAGVKLHAHVMGIAPDDRRLWPVYEELCARDKPLVFHAGLEPESDAYPRACDSVSGLARLGAVLRDFPMLRCVIPHLGASEFGLAAELLERYPSVMLDCAMVLARYFPDGPGREWVARYADRIFYGTDFPILPYDYDRERRCILGLALGAAAEDAIFWGNAARFFRVG